MKKKLFFLVLAVLFLGGASLYSYKLYNKPHKSASEEKPFLEISAEDLISKVQNSQEQTSSQLLNKVIQVSGTVSKVEKGAESTLIILSNGIKCEADNKDDFNSISTNKEIVIRGFYSGYDDMFNEISLIRCHIKK